MGSQKKGLEGASERERVQLIQIDRLQENLADYKQIFPENEDCASGRDMQPAHSTILVQILNIFLIEIGQVLLQTLDGHNGRLPEGGTEVRSGSEAGSYSKLIDFVCH